MAQRNNEKYSHEKCEGKSVYSHKKFGICLSTTPPKAATKTPSAPTEVTPTSSLPQTNTSCTVESRSANLFRPYALTYNTPRKRKYQELQNNYQNSEQHQMEYKRFAYTTTPPTDVPVYPTDPTYVVNPLNFVFNPLYGWQYQCQFNPQMFTLILRTQMHAIHMGEIIKRQGHLNFHNIIG